MFEIRIRNGNAAFRDGEDRLDPCATELRRILFEISKELSLQDCSSGASGTIMDVNGNAVGEWKVTDDLDDDPKEAYRDAGLRCFLPDRIYTESGKFRITDPGYAPDIWCADTVSDAKPGWYLPFVEFIENAKRGRRIRCLGIVHYDNPQLRALELDDFDEELSSEVGVDSGQCGIFNLEYFNQVLKDEAWYEKVYGLTSRPGNPNTAGVLDHTAVVSASGYGDGVYTCFLHRDAEGVVDGILVRFLD